MCLSIAIARPQDVLAKGEHEGFQWIVTNNGRGYRCGYVRVPVGHPWHGEDYDKVVCEVHGGLTFGERDVSCDKGGADDGWWLGFDCAHAWDAADPSLRGYKADWDFGVRHGEVRTQEYVESQCRSLCEQAASAN